MANELEQSKPRGEESGVFNKWIHTTLSALPHAKPVTREMDLAVPRKATGNFKSGSKRWLECRACHTEVMGCNQTPNSCPLQKGALSQVDTIVSQDTNFIPLVSSQIDWAGRKAVDQLEIVSSPTQRKGQTELLCCSELW